MNRAAPILPVGSRERATMVGGASDRFIRRGSKQPRSPSRASSRQKTGRKGKEDATGTACRGGLSSLGARGGRIKRDHWEAYVRAIPVVFEGPAIRLRWKPWGCAGAGIAAKCWNDGLQRSVPTNTGLPLRGIAGVDGVDIFYTFLLCSCFRATDVSRVRRPPCRLSL